MGSPASRRLDPERFEGHPALAAWRALGGAVPAAIVAVKEERRSRIYRLEGARPGDSDVVAKRGSAASIALERLVHEELLAPLAIGSPRCLGLVPDADPRFAWLFLEDAGGAGFDADLPAHRTAAAAWLAELHTRSEGRAALRQLPDRGPAHHLEELRRSRRRIAGSFENPALRAADRELLDALLRGLDVVSSHWSVVEEACERSPSVLVHGDFAGRNLRVEGEGARARLRVIGWKAAGRGAPGIDLVRADPGLYARALRERWPGLDVPRQAWIGRLLRGCLMPIGWATPGLDVPSVERPLAALASYRRRLQRFLAESGWSGGDAPARLRPGRLASDDPREHPAARAWRRLGRSDAGLTRVECLWQVKRSQVYRLRGIGPSGSLVAKRTSRAIAAIELCIYQQALPRLPLRSLGFEGSLEEPDAWWLFLEDAGSERAAGPEARRLLTDWLAGLHTSAAGVAAELPLPDRGAAYHRERLREARGFLLGSLGNPILAPADRWVLRALAEGMLRLDASWGEIEALCARMPRTLVHGDLIPKNLHLRRTAGAAELLVLDWEMAGVGPVAVDLLDVDAARYAALVAKSWPEVTPERVARWQRCGRLLRSIVATRWEGPQLATPWIERTMACLRIYRRELEESLSSLGGDAARDARGALR